MYPEGEAGSRGGGTGWHRPDGADGEGAECWGLGLSIPLLGVPMGVGLHPELHLHPGVGLHPGIWHPSMSLHPRMGLLSGVLHPVLGLHPMMGSHPGPGLHLRFACGGVRGGRRSPSSAEDEAMLPATAGCGMPSAPSELHWRGLQR